MSHFLPVIAIIACVALAPAEPVKAIRGLAAQVEVDYGPTLRARADQTPTSPILVRISPGRTDGHQRIEFIGAVAGNFDLREYIEREDGRAIADLAPIPITVESQLPADHGVDLYATSGSWMNWRAHYREFMWGAVALWGAVPIAALGVRALRRPRPIEASPPVPPPPSVADQLRAALELARERSLSVEESGRLELLLLRYLSGGDPAAGVDLAQVLRDVRAHEETRPLVLAVERWLHAKGGGESARVHAAAALEELRRTRLATPRAVGVPA